MVKRVGPRRPRERGVSLDMILDEFIGTGVFSKEQEDRARQQVRDLKKERAQNVRGAKDLQSNP